MTKISKGEKTIKILEELSGKLFSLMGVSPKADISFDKDSEAYLINVDAGDEAGLLIGRKGETLISIQTVLGILLKQDSGEWSRVLVNVGDYREKEEDYLKNLAESAMQRAIETQEPQSLYNLKPGQRRIIHMFLSENSAVETESVGEGENRYLLVKPRA